MTSMALDYSSNTYLAITFSPTSPFYAAPATLSSDPHIASARLPLAYVGNVGSLPDTHLFSLPKTTYENVKDQIFAVFGEMTSDVTAIDVQIPKQRSKRVMEEL